MTTAEALGGVHIQTRSRKGRGGAGTSSSSRVDGRAPTRIHTEGDEPGGSKRAGEMGPSEDAGDVVVVVDKVDRTRRRSPSVVAASTPPPARWSTRTSDDPRTGGHRSSVAGILRPVHRAETERDGLRRPGTTTRESSGGRESAHLRKASGSRPTRTRTPPPRDGHRLVSLVALAGRHRPLG